MRKIFIKGIKGGTGATSIVANLACALRKSDEDVIAIDLDSKSDLGLHFGLSWEHTSGWSNYLSFESALDEFHIDDDGVIFLPFGTLSANTQRINKTIESAQQLQVNDSAWLLFDCPAHQEIQDYDLSSNDIVLEVINCDSVCHSLVYRRLLQLNQCPKKWQHYFLINNYNSACELESDLLQVWQAETPLLAPVHINKDEVVKESTAFRNVAVNCAPYSVAHDDFETLASWLVTRAANND